MTDEITGLPAEALGKYDGTNDRLFYSQPRFVAHIDHGAIAAVTNLYRSRLLAGATVLDLMSSWISHLPEDVTFGEVIGLGMNAEELAANPRLTRSFVHDLNAEPTIPLADGSVDAAIMCVSVQYLQRPVSVLRDVRRVLRPSGQCIITFSNRCFPTKAVAIWGALDGTGRKRLVATYLRQAGFIDVEAFDPVSESGSGDPLHAVVGRSPAEGQGA